MDRNKSNKGNLGTVDIRPGVTVLSVLRHLNYSPWFALAEFVDNAIQSYSENKPPLSPGREILKVEIDIDSSSGGRITVRDNAGGISEKDFPRAFRAAAMPPDRSGLSEFGMGMKSAACWFSPVWSVRTSAYGEALEREVIFNIENIVRDEIDELEVKTRPASPDAHFTEIVLEKPYKLPAGRTVAKIKDHLTDIYRVFTREGTLQLFLNGQKLEYEDPEILDAPYFRDEQGKAICWKKEIAFDFGGGLSVHGFAAIRRTGSTSRAGFALFRRKRLIEGSGDEGYRPEYIFNQSSMLLRSYAG